MILTVFGFFDHIDASVKLFFEDGHDSIFFEEIFLLFSDHFIFFVGVDNLRAEENDDVGFSVGPVAFREDGANDGKSSQARDARFIPVFGVLDHTAEDHEVLVGNMDPRGHRGVAGGNSVDVIRARAGDIGSA